MRVVNDPTCSWCGEEEESSAHTLCRCETLGLWEFTVMPFGLCNAPATFERLMETVLKGLSWETCLVYLDDIIVVGKSFDDHLKNLEQVFRRLRQSGPKLSPKKCHLFQKKVQYLGHAVSQEGIAVDPQKIEAVKGWPVPKNKHDVRSFLGLCTYYRRYVAGFATIAKPLTRLTEEGRRFQWENDCQQAFDLPKKALSTAPVLSYPLPTGREEVPAADGPCISDIATSLASLMGMRMRTTIVDDRWQPTELQKDQEEDPSLKLIIEWKREDRRPSWQEVSPYSPTVKSYWAQWDSLVMEDGILRRILEDKEGTQERRQTVVPRNRVAEVLGEIHSGTNGGHLGVAKALEKVRERFYWFRCKEDVKEWCRKCTVCAASNGPQRRKKAPMRQYNVGSPFERIAIDVAGPFPESEAGNKYIVVVIDYFSKWVEAYALPNQEAATVSDALVKDWTCRFGVPLELHSDQGRNFESALFQNVCETLGIRKTRTTALHPQSDGMVERINRTVNRYLAKVVSDHQRDWDSWLHLFLLAYRSAVHETTGETPASIVFGREHRLPCDLMFSCKPGDDVAGEDYNANLRRRMDEAHEKVRHNIRTASDRMKMTYDVGSSETAYQPGDLVWLCSPQKRRGLPPKLQSSWEGPYEVVKKINDVIYRIKKANGGKPRVVHFNRLAPFAGDNAEAQVRELQQLHPELNFEDFVATHTGTAKARFGVTREEHRDLFTVPDEYALAHCVARDLRMSRGIASELQRLFGQVDELKRQGGRVGQVLELRSDQRRLYYLISKEKSYQKPTYRTVW
ncbi:unnamed protein product [Callosobruchus maculatus]|uniref:RNA-directed DNA polymerase n=1 Tax=Callosobruchus maculatus TaxID=64391 RepID=A0A653CAP5_CALMS|nr:unnamed protein product [Callosobruchus maculatus]